MSRYIVTINTQTRVAVEVETSNEAAALETAKIIIDEAQRDPDASLVDNVTVFDQSKDEYILTYCYPSSVEVADLLATLSARFTEILK